MGFLITFHDVKDRIGSDKRLLSAFTVAVSVLSLPFFNPEVRQIVLPILVIANSAVFFVTSLWCRSERETIPIFEIGMVYCAVLTVYSLVPLINYLLGDMRWSGLSDQRLLAYPTPPEDIGDFAWNYVVYFSSFTTIYLWARGKIENQQSVPTVGDSPPMLTILLPLLALLVYFYLMNAFWGVDANPSYLNLRDNEFNQKRLPLLALQCWTHLRGIMLILKMALLLLLFEKWERKRWRVVICSWLALETAYMCFNMGARVEATTLLMSAPLFYHRLVKPIRLSHAVAAGLLFIGGFLVIGMARSYITKGGRSVPPVTFRSVASMTNEFQSIFATAYDLGEMKKTGQLGAIPAQLYFSDFLAPVPQQLLPMKKLDPSEWYLSVRGINDGTGYMFGVIAQSVVGSGLIELALRGAIVAVLFAWAHRWYVQRSSRFLPILVYSWLCIWSYYTFRASTFYLLSPIIYRVLPAVSLIYISTRVMRRPQPIVRRGCAPTL